MKRLISGLLPLLFSALLLSVMVGCGGGSSSGGGSTAVRSPEPIPLKDPIPPDDFMELEEPKFTSWPDVEPEETYFLSGISQDSEYTVKASPESDRGVISWVEPDADLLITDDSIFTFSTDVKNEIVAMSINTPTASVSFSKSKGDEIFVHDDFLIAQSKDKTREAFYMIPEEFGWNYQTFGFWLTGVYTSSGRIGAASVGSLTPVDRIPTEGTATYKGKSLGEYIDPSGQNYLAKG